MFAVVNRLPTTTSDEQRKTVIEYIITDKIKNEPQFTGKDQEEEKKNLRKKKN